MKEMYLDIEIDLSRDALLDDYGINMLKGFYLKPWETSPQHGYARAAAAWSVYKGVRDFALSQRLYDYVSKGWFMFASPVLSNAPQPGFKNSGMPISCFLGYVPDTVSGLIEHTTELRWLSVMGGGVGGHWSDVRTISDVAPGPIPFIHTVDADMTAYRQGKTRKGSYAAYMNIDHPDILEFISIRVPTGDENRKAFNIHNAVNITDKFMAAVKAGEKYELMDPKKGSTGTFLDARVVYQQLLETRFRTGEPYLNFINTANKALPPSQKKLGLKIHGSNLCNEIHLATSEDRTAVCCLSSPNVEFYPDWKDTTMLYDLTIMLDNVLEYFIENAPKELWRAVNSAKKERALGLGLMGWDYLLQKKGLHWGSEEASALNIEIAMQYQLQTGLASQDMAVQRGEPEDMIGTSLRNSHRIALAPNASSSIILRTSPSAERSKANVYVQRTRAGSGLVKNPHLKKMLAEKYNMDNEAVWNQILKAQGSVLGLPFMDDYDKKIFLTADEEDQANVILHAAERQPFICQGQSVNLHYKPGVDRKLVLKHHIMAYEKGLKGLYYLRTASKQRPEDISQQVQENKLEDMEKTIIYGKPGCSQCTMAKNLFDKKGIEYEYIDVVALGKTAAEVTGRPDARSLPQIYIDGKYIGGFAEAYEYVSQDDDVEDGAEADASYTNQDGNECVACEG